MAVDTSIYNALGRGVKTVRDWQQEDEQRQQVAQANELNALNLTNARATAGDNALVRQDQTTLRNALQSYKPGDDLASLYAGTRTPTGMKMSQEVQKAAAEAESLKAKTAASTAAAGSSTASQKATEYKLQIDKHNTALNDILSFQTPAEAMESLRRHAASGQIPQEAVQAMSRELMGVGDEAQFEAWKDGKAGALMDAKSRAELALRRQEAQDRRTNQAGEAANRDLVLDPVSGRYVLNQPLQNAKVQRAASGASTTNINTGQKGLDNELKVRGDFRQEPVYKAHQEMQSAHSQIQQSLKQASPAGDLAAATKMMKLLDPGSVVRESELGMAMAATGLLDRIQAFVPNIINGTKLTPDQRKQFQSLADALYGESVGQFNAKRGEYADLGGGYGMNTDRLLGPKATSGKQAPAGKPKPAGASTDLGGGFSLKN